MLVLEALDFVASQDQCTGDAADIFDDASTRGFSRYCHVYAAVNVTAPLLSMDAENVTAPSVSPPKSNEVTRNSPA